MSDIDIDATQQSAEEKAKQLPKPKGFKILCMVPHIEEKYEGGLLKAGATVNREELTTQVLFVVELGDMAYSDANRFPTGPWCQKGDFVLTRTYAGTRMKIHDREFRIINDDTVEAVVEDPRGLSHA